MSTLSEFIAHIKQHNIVRSNRFRITFSLPAALNAIIGGLNAAPVVLGSSSNTQSSNIGAVGVSKIISLTCIATDVPGISISTVDAEYGSITRRIANGRSFENFATTFLLSGAMIEKKVMDDWYSAMFTDSNNSLAYYDDYVSSIMVEQLDTKDNVIYVFELQEAYPGHVGPVRLDRSQSNSQSLFDVNWNYHRIKVDPDSFSLAALQSIPVPSSSLDNTSGSALNNLPTMPASVTSITLNGTSGPAVNGLIANVNNTINQVKLGNISNLDGVKLINAAFKDFNLTPGVPDQVKADVSIAVNKVKSQMSNLALDPTTITN
jgi:hypothetical protein